MSMKKQLVVPNSQNSQDNKMILHKISWGNNRFGKRSGKQKPFEEGENLLRPARLNEIVPNREEYFMRPNGDGNKYYLINDGFSEKVEYQSIKDLVDAGCVYVRNNFSL